MTEKDFINSKLFKERILFDIFDVDEFVLKVARDLQDNYDIWNLKGVKRYSFEKCRVENDKFYQEEMSTEEYIKRKEDEEDFMCYTKLNYEEFEKDFPIGELEDWYGDERTYKSGLLKTIFNWIDNINSSSSKKIRLRDLINEIKRSQFALKNIKSGWNNNIPLNEIQKEVIELHKQFNRTILKEITSRYQDIFPKLFKKEKTEIKNSHIPKNPFPRIFKDNQAYILFDNLKDNLCNDDRTILADYSFVFRIMYKEKYIHGGVQESEFRDFLSKAYQIEIDKLKTLNNCSPQKKVDLYNLIKQQSVPK